MVSSVLRIAPSAEGVSIWSAEIFGGSGASRVREFLSRAFAVEEVAGVELRRARSFGRIQYGSVSDPAQVWKKLSRAITQPGAAAARPETDALFLDLPSATSIRVSRVGGALSTWRVRQQADDKLQLWHPLLRNRPDVLFRLEEELAGIIGVEDFRASRVTAGLSIRFDKAALNAERLARALETAWPRLLAGADGPPSRTRFVASLGLAGLSFTGQYLVPPLRPVAVAGVALYGLPNVINAVKDLRRGEIGLSALYTAGLGFTLRSGMPFASSAIAVLMQFWPQLARRKFVRSRRRLITREHRRATWARVLRAQGAEAEVHVDELRNGDRISVRHGETVPADGVVESGCAAVENGLLFGTDRLEDRWQGDAIAAGALVRAGQVTIRVERNPAALGVRDVSSLLPHSALADLPSLQEAERIANRNAKPALALSALSLAATRTLRPSQILLRPDYATAPRLSAQLSALYGVAEGLHLGILFRNPAALDRLTGADVYLIDDSAELNRRGVEVAAVHPVNGVSADQVVGYLLAALSPGRADNARALAAFAAKRKIEPAKAENLRRGAGVTRYQDRNGHAIEIASSKHLTTSKASVPKVVSAAAEGNPGNAPALRPLCVLRNGEVIGVVSFARTGELVAKQAIAAIKARDPQAQFVYLSRGTQAEAQALAGELGIERAEGGLSQATKVDRIRGLGSKTIWIGDGSDAGAHEAMAASTISVSVAALSSARPDRADVLLPQKGLDGLPEAIDVGRAHRARLARDYRTLYAINLLGAAGGLFNRVTSLHVGLLSNAGTALIYAQHARDLDRLALAAEKRRARSRNPGSTS